MKNKGKISIKNRMLKVFVLLLGVAFFTAGQAALSITPTFAAHVPESFAGLVTKTKDAVVNISTTQIVKQSPLIPFFMPNTPFGNFIGPMPQKKMKIYALGSGFVISKNGLILTNNHVISKATSIKVKLDNGKEYKAKIVGRDPKTDLGLVKVKPDKYFPKPVKLGNSDAIRVGDWVMAVGNPFGLGQTVTTGIISAKGRIIGAGPYDDFLQTDAAINPGNSGGPLFNMQGEVIGINTAIIRRGQNIGFAIPIDLAKKLLPQLKKGKVIRGWLGVEVQNLTTELARSFGIKTKKGVLISNVFPESPADKAGLKHGDIIVAFNGENIKDAHDISRFVAATQPGKKITIKIIRNGQEKLLKVTIGTMHQREKIASAPNIQNTWGITVQEITPELDERLGLNPGEKGVVISGVHPGSPAADVGLHPGDIILEVNREKIRNVKDYYSVLRKAKNEKGLLLLIKRRNGNIYLVLQKDVR